jgi:prepilin-type N-terminal cleavage/methylation domain-containing protein
MMGVLEYFLRNHLKHSKQVKQESGFTLIELLVAMVLAVLVITPLLGFMINILDNDRREQAKTTSEQEVQTALDYISRDLQQALYIYDADALSRDFNTDATLSGIRDQLPPVKAAGMCRTVAGTQCLPVLAFWKRKLEKDAIKIGTKADDTDDTFVYSLVTYYLVKDSNATWSKAARIARFEISDGVQSAETSAVTCTDYPDEKFVKDKCPDTGFKRFTLNDKRGTIQQKMNQWKAQTTAYPPQSVPVLIDFVDQTTNLPAATCPANEKDADGNEITKWSKITPGSFTSFYACVETLKTPNSTVELSLRGNALARLQNDNIDYNQNNKSYFPTASIRVEGRGYLFTK